MEPLSNTVEIVEVGPRDGLQSIKTTIATSRKIELIRDLYNSGLRRIEIGSFVSSSAIPQFADITEFVEATRSLRELDTQVLVPTERRANEAIAAGARHLVFVLSVSNIHNRSNVRRSTAESVIEFGRIVSRVPADTRIRVNIATAFDCPFEGTSHRALPWRFSTNSLQWHRPWKSVFATPLGERCQIKSRPYSLPA